MSQNENTSSARRILETITLLMSQQNFIHQLGTPSEIFCTPPTTAGFEMLLDAVKKGITDHDKLVVEQAVLLSKRLWAAEFADAYIDMLESEDAGQGHHTTELAIREQTLLPAMRQKVSTADTRLNDCKSVIAQLEMIQRLVVSVKGRLKPEGTEEEMTKKEKEQVQRGLQLIDSEWVKLHTQLRAAVAFRELDDSDPVEFIYRWILTYPDGRWEEKESDAMDGPVVLDGDWAECRYSGPVFDVKDLKNVSVGGEEGSGDTWHVQVKDSEKEKEDEEEEDEDEESVEEKNEEEKNEEEKKETKKKLKKRSKGEKKNRKAKVKVKKAAAAAAAAAEAEAQAAAKVAEVEAEVAEMEAQVAEKKAKVAEARAKAAAAALASASAAASSLPVLSVRPPTPTPEPECYPILHPKAWAACFAWRPLIDDSMVRVPGEREGELCGFGRDFKTEYWASRREGRRAESCER